MDKHFNPSDFFQEWEPSEKDRKVDALAAQYQTETEAFDRTVCSGPIRHGEILPASAQELALINKNARVVFKRLLAEGSYLGITSAELCRAIGKTK